MHKNKTISSKFSSNPKDLHIDLRGKFPDREWYEYLIQNFIVVLCTFHQLEGNSNIESKEINVSQGNVLNIECTVNINILTRKKERKWSGFFFFFIGINVKNVLKVN